MFYFLICFSSPTRGIRGSGLQWLPSTSLPYLMLTHPLQVGFCLARARLQLTSPGSSLHRLGCWPAPAATLLRGKQPPWEAHGQAQWGRASPSSWNIQRLPWKWWALPEPTRCPRCGCTQTNSAFPLSCRKQSISFVVLK